MRLSDWEARLSGYVTRVAAEGLSYGRHDCALFAAGAIEAVTGADPAADFRGRYKTARGGIRHMRACGFADHIDFARKQFSEIPAAHVMPGDLAVVGQTDGPDALGVVQGAMIYVLTETMIGLVPLAQARSFLGVR